MLRGTLKILFSTLSADVTILKVKIAHFLLVSNDPPLNLKAPKPSFSNARNGPTHLQVWPALHVAGTSPF